MIFRQAFLAILFLQLFFFTAPHDAAAEEVVIPGVPDYQQADYPGLNDCSPTAAACVLGYWDANGYPDLVDAEGEGGLVQALKDNSNYSGASGTTDSIMAEAVEIVCNDPDENNNYGFLATYDSSVTYGAFQDEIDSGRPVIHIVYDYPGYGDHSMAGVGYHETATEQWCVNHDLWHTTPEEIYIPWGTISDNMTTVIPGGRNDKTLSGYVRTSGGQGIEGVAVTFRHSSPQDGAYVSDGVAFTDGSGYYEFHAYYAWNGRSQPSKDGYVFSPVYRTYPDVVQDQSGRDFTGGTTPQTVEIVGPVEVEEADGVQYYCLWQPVGGESVDVTASAAWSEDSSYAEISSSGYLTTGGVAVNHEFTITASYGGGSDTHVVTIVDAPPVLTGIEITGPSEVAESSGAQYACTAYYDDGGSADVTGAASWSENGEAATIGTDGYLDTFPVTADRQVTLTAGFGGASDDHAVTVHNSVIQGDVDGDGSATVADAVMVIRAVSGLDPEGVHPDGDADADGKIGLADGVYILQTAAGLR